MPVPLFIALSMPDATRVAAITNCIKPASICKLYIASTNISSLRSLLLYG